MDHSRFAVVVRDDADLIGRLVTALAAQGDLPISVARSGETVLAFESITGDMMLRSRVVQTLPAVTGRPSRDRSPSHGMTYSPARSVGV